MRKVADGGKTVHAPFVKEGHKECFHNIVFIMPKCDFIAAQLCAGQRPAVLLRLYKGVYTMKLQKLLSYVRRAVDDYHMIQAGDKIAVLYAAAGNKAPRLPFRHIQEGADRIQLHTVKVADGGKTVHAPFVKEGLSL